MVLILRQIAFGVQSRHTARTGRGNCLAINMVNHIARGKNAFNICFGTVSGLNITLFIQFDLALKNFSVWGVANRQKHAVTA